MAEFIHKYICFNGELIENKGFKSEKKTQISVYEVLRLIGGIPLFYQDHLKRLQNSLKLTEYCEFNPINNIFPKLVKTLCEANNMYFGNLELRLIKCENNQVDYVIGFIQHRYPKPTEYLNGIPTAIMQADRKNPNAKVKDTLTRQRANAKLKELSVYELLLENSNGILTEGSRSNLFFIKNNQVFTAPEPYVLPGITRQYAILALKQADIEIVETPVHVNELEQFMGAFICGTSPGILSIKSIDHHEFNVKSTLLSKLQAAFNHIVEDYLKKEQLVFAYNVG